MNARILLNAGAGSTTDRHRVEDALAGAGVSGEPQWLEGGAIAAEAKAAVDGAAELVIAGGGDGTMSTVAGALAGTGTRLAILPLGTRNHFARDLGIPLDPVEAAELIARGREQRVDVAEVNGRVFVNNSAIGLYPLMVINREAQQMKLGRSRRLAMAVAAARTLLRFSSRRLSLTVNDRTSHVETPLLLVGNNAYGIEMPGAGTRERLDAGELSVVVLRRNSRLGFCAATVRALLGRHRHSDVVQIDEVRQLRVDARRPSLTISLDGEIERMQTPLTYRIRPKALRLIAPAGESTEGRGATPSAERPS